MAYIFQEHDGLVSVVVDGKLPDPFMYIDTRGAPPYKLEPVGGTTIELETFEAAKAALIMNMKG